MDERTNLLLRLGSALYQLGIRLESRQNRVKQLMTQGSSHQSPELLQLLRECQLLQGQFASLEEQYSETIAELQHLNLASMKEQCREAAAK